MNINFIEYLGKAVKLIVIALEVRPVGGVYICSIKEQGC